MSTRRPTQPSPPVAPTPSPTTRGASGTTPHQSTPASPPGDGVPASLRNLERDIFETLETSPDRSASFLQDPIPEKLNHLIRNVMDGDDQVCRLFVNNHLTNLKAIAKFGDREIGDILGEFPLKTILQNQFTHFMVIVRTLTVHLKAFANGVREKDTPLGTPNPDTYLLTFLIVKMRPMNIALSLTLQTLNAVEELDFVNGLLIMMNMLNALH